MGEKIREIGTLIFVKKYATCAFCIKCVICAFYIFCVKCAEYTKDDLNSLKKCAIIKR